MSQVNKVNAFTVSGVERAKKRLKGLQERVRSNKDGRDTEALLEVCCISVQFFACAPEPVPAQSLCRCSSAAPADWTSSCGCLLQDAKAIGDDFLALEKYVNLNYLVRLAAGTATAATCAEHLSHVLRFRLNTCGGLLPARHKT